MQNFCRRCGRQVGLKARKWHTLVTLNVFPQRRIVGGGEKALFTMESLFPMEVNLRFSCYKDACANLFLKDSQRFMMISLLHVPQKIITIIRVE